jgi:hypothetical protein
LRIELSSQHCTVRRGPHEIRKVVDVGRVHATADRDPVHDQRALVDATAHHAFDGLEAVDVVELESALDAGCAEAPDVLLDPARPGRDDHLAVRGPSRRLGQRGAGVIGRLHLLDNIHLHGVDRHRDLVRLRRQLGEHVPGVVRQPLCRPALALRREGDRAADLQHHIGHDDPQPANSSLN